MRRATVVYRTVPMSVLVLATALLSLSFCGTGVVVLTATTAWRVWLGCMMLAELLALLTIWRSARVTVDAQARTFTVERTRWPFKPLSWTVPVSDVQGVRVVDSQGRRGARQYRVFVDLRAAAPRALLDSWSTDPALTGNAVEKMRSLVQAAR